MWKIENEIDYQICAMRGRNPDNPSDRSCGCHTVQRLEPNENGICNTLTSVQKDNLLVSKEKIVDLNDLVDEKYNNFIYQIDGDMYLIRIRKLIPKECWSLMGFSEEDFMKAQSVNSSTQLFKQAGNSIGLNCLIAIFGQMLEGKEDVYKEWKQKN